MKRTIILFVIALVWPLTASAATSADHPHYKADVDVSDKASLERGARTFMNYCMGCHSAAYMRYNRMGEDLGIEESILQSNLMFGTEKSGDTMTIAMQKEDAEAFFGTAATCLVVVLQSLDRTGAERIYLVAGSALYCVGCVLVTMLFSVPLNNRLASVQPDSEESTDVWTQYLSRWVLWNHVRTTASFLAALMLLMGWKLHP